MDDAAVEPPKTLAEATERFVQFLPKAGYPNHVRWIFRDDVVIDSHNRLWTRSNADARIHEAERLYEEGLRRNIGIALHALCVAGGETLAIVIVPSDDLDSQYRLMSPGRLKLSALTSIARALTVRC